MHALYQRTSSKEKCYDRDHHLSSKAKFVFQGNNQFQNKNVDIMFSIKWATLMHQKIFWIITAAPDNDRMLFPYSRKLVMMTNFFFCLLALAARTVRCNNHNKAS